MTISRNFAQVFSAIVLMGTLLTGQLSAANAYEIQSINVAVGDTHACALLESGSVACWGGNGAGQLGLGYRTTYEDGDHIVDKPTVVPGLTHVQSLAAGGDQTCAILLSGSVMCWGANYTGQLGLGYASPFTHYWIATPTLVPTLSRVRSLALSSSHSCALLIDGKVKCWGENMLGMLGFSASLDFAIIATPTLVPGLTNVESLALSRTHTCALLSTREVKCWGQNNLDELGLGGYSDPRQGVAVPTTVPGLSNVKSIFVGIGDSCAILVTEVVKCWGDNVAGELGLGYATDDYSNGEYQIDLGISSPTTVPGLFDVDSLALGNRRSCALLKSGQVECWGANYFGELGLGYESPRDTPPIAQPTLIPGLSHVKWIGMEGTSCAELADRTLTCWGFNDVGQLGNGSSQASSSPIVLGNLKVAPQTSVVQLGPLQNAQLSAVQATSATLTFQAPQYADYSDSLIGVQYSLDGGFSWQIPVAATSESALNIDGLSPGFSYLINVRAIYVDGPGESSGPITFTTLVVPASAPSIAVSSVGKTSVTLSVTAPTSLGDVALSGYDYSIDNGSTWKSFASADGPFTINGLTPNQSYQIKVRAINSAGAGAPSTAVNAYPTTKLPVTPAILSAVRGDQQVNVTLKTPTDVTAQSITGYQYNLNNGALWNPVTLSKGAFAVTGLANGSNYAIRVRAINVNGRSGWSSPMSATPMTTASAPTIQNITPGNSSLTVTFAGALNNGGSVAKNYQYSLDGGSTWKDCSPALKLSPTLVIKNVTNGTTYQVAIRMVNAVGPGAASTAVSGIPMTVPSGVKASALAGQTMAIFTLADFANGGSPITSYAFSLDNKNWNPVTPTSGKVTITGLTPLTSYKIYLRASNVMGNGAVSSFSVRTQK
jgi:alpha-tubulin suppressor-like RCC1 family protein